MPDTTEVQESRAYRPDCKKRKPRHSKPEKRKSNGSLAEAELDRRLAKAIAERADAMVKVSELTYWQDRLNRLNQEIDSLLSMQSRLLGGGAPPVQNWTPSITPGISPSSEYSPLASIPANITSAPARQPKPTTPNMAESIKSEPGFS